MMNTTLRLVRAVANELLEKCGGPGSGVPGPCPGVKPKRKPKPKTSHQAYLEAYPPKKQGTLDSQSRFRSKSGLYTKERHALHKKIIAEHFEGKTPVKNPVGVLMGGGPASGKSHVVSSGKINIPKNTVTIDSDKIKGMLPEYQHKVKQGDLNAAGYVHEESRYIAKKIHKQAVLGSYNSVLDGTGAGGVEGVARRAKHIRAAGGKVIGEYVTVPTEVAVSRSRARAKETGRKVPDSKVRWSHSSVSATTAEAIRKGVFDKFSLWDNTGKNPVQVATAKGRELTIHEPEMWSSFLAKADK